MSAFTLSPFQEFLSGFHPSDKEVRVHVKRNTWSKVWHDGVEAEEVLNSVPFGPSGLNPHGGIDVPGMHVWIMDVFNPLFEAGSRLFLCLRELRIEGTDTVIPIDQDLDEHSTWHDLVSQCSRHPNDGYVMIYDVCCT